MASAGAKHKTASTARRRGVPNVIRMFVEELWMVKRSYSPCSEMDDGWREKEGVGLGRNVSVSEGLI
jgi:hypothetical protein